VTSVGRAVGSQRHYSGVIVPQPLRIASGSILAWRASGKCQGRTQDWKAGITVAAKRSIVASMLSSVSWWSSGAL